MTDMYTKMNNTEKINRALQFDLSHYISKRRMKMIVEFENFNEMERQTM